jgi:hypothetical protein
VGQGLLVIDSSLYRSDTSHSVGFLWTSDRPDAEISTWQHATLTRETSTPPAGFEPAIRAAAHPRLKSVATGIGHQVKLAWTNQGGWQLFWRNLQSRDRLEGQSVIGRIILNWILRSIVLECRVNVCGSGYEQVAGSCVHGNEPSVSVKCVKFPE